MNAHLKNNLNAEIDAFWLGLDFTNLRTVPLHRRGVSMILGTIFVFKGAAIFSANFGDYGKRRALPNRDITLFLARNDLAKLRGERLVLVVNRNSEHSVFLGEILE